MEEWKRVSLRDVTDIIGDGLHGTPLFSTNGEYAFVNGNNLSDGIIDIKADTKMCELSEYEKYRKELSDRTLFLSINGTIGNTAKYNGEKIILGKSACYLNVKKDYNLDYIYYVLRSPAFQTAITGLATGTTIKNVSLKTIREYEFSAPNYEKQTRIAGMLRAIDDKIQNNNRINHNLEEQAQALYKSWFVDFEPFKDGKFVESELGMIPKGWSIIPFKDFLSPFSRKVPVGMYPEYSVTNTGIVPRAEKFNKRLSGSMSYNKELRKYDLVFGMSREILNWGIMLDEVGSVSSAYNIYDIDEEFINPLYLKYYIEHRISYFGDLIGTAAREGQSLDKGALMQKNAIVPPAGVLDSFMEKDIAIRKGISALLSENSHLVSFRDSLLPKLMSGEITC